jgi:hypothetical protein
MAEPSQANRERLGSIRLIIDDESFWRSSGSVPLREAAVRGSVMWWSCAPGEKTVTYAIRQHAYRLDRAAANTNWSTCK